MRKNNSNPSHSQSNTWNSATYRTGFTAPRKSHTGLIVFLLVLIIALCGAVTFLGIANVRLFRARNSQASAPEAPISLSRVSSPATTPVSIHSAHLEEPAKSIDTPLGLEGECLPGVGRRYFRLPEGMYIQSVDPVSNSAQMGICPGDIILSLNDTPITSPMDLYEALADYTAGETITLTIYRNSQEIRVYVTVEGDWSDILQTGNHD